MITRGHISLTHLPYLYIWTVLRNSCIGRKSFFNSKSSSLIALNNMTSLCKQSCSYRSYLTTLLLKLKLIKVQLTCKPPKALFSIFLKHMYHQWTNMVNMSLCSLESNNNLFPDPEVTEIHWPRQGDCRQYRSI